MALFREFSVVLFYTNTSSYAFHSSLTGLFTWTQFRLPLTSTSLFTLLSSSRTPVPLLHQMSKFSPPILAQHKHQSPRNLPQMLSLQMGVISLLRILTAFYLYLSNGISNEASQSLKPRSLRPRVTFLLGPVWCYPQHLTQSFAVHRPLINSVVLKVWSQDQKYQQIWELVRNADCLAPPQTY